MKILNINRKTLLWLCAALFITVTTSAQTKTAPLAFKERKLDNGLRVITLQDKSSPTVAVQVWYNVGSKDDPNGKSGFAHLFEHLMFKSSKKLKSEQFDRLTEDVGGFNNADTGDDRTRYYEVVPSNYLESILWAEADRMVNLNVNQENFASERDVVKEEFRQGVLAQPYGRFFNAIDRLSFQVHPYKRSTIGNIAELDAATLEDVRTFYQTYYRPDGAVLIIAGDFDEKQLNDWINKYFAGIKRPTTTIPRVTVQEPERTKEQRFVETAPNVPLPAIALTYLAPTSKSADAPALKVADAILSDGESSRIYQEIVYKQQLAQNAGFQSDIRTDKGLLYFYAIAAGGKTLKQLETSLLAEIKKAQDAPPTAKELEKAKNKLLTNNLNELETNDGKATAIGEAVLYFNDASEVNRELEKLRAVTAADVQRVMKKYFTDTNRVVIYYQNETAKETK
ncbi:MAG: insulinase family protein [Pyrinomonadaceae bacterium]|nr:insulinase family protein [Pyrinomonadaceae bacterium]